MIEYLDILRESGKKLYVNFGRDNYTSWIKILNCDENSALKEAEGINAFISKHPGIKGLLLRNLEPDFVIIDLFLNYIYFYHNINYKLFISAKNTMIFVCNEIIEKVRYCFI